MSKLRVTIVLTLLLLCVTSSFAQRRKVEGKKRVYHKVVVRKAQVRYAHLPRWGAVVTTVPSSAIVIKHRKHPYYFYNGLYYVKGNMGYAVVRPAPGIRIKVLPRGYRRVTIGTRPYYYYYGTFYVLNHKEYEVVDAPANVVVDALPDGYEVVAKEGTEYYVLDGVYYAEVDAPEFEDGVGYEVVKL